MVKYFELAREKEKQKSSETRTVTKQTPPVVMSLEKPRVRNFRKVVLVCSHFKYAVLLVCYELP